MRKLLIALAALAGVISASYFAIGAPVPIIGPATGCMEANQLLNCLNSQVVNTLRGVPNGVTQTAPFQYGTYGTASGATSVTLNTQGGVASFTGVTIAAVSSQALTINDSLVSANSACVATVVSDSGSAAASFPYIRNVTPTAGVLTVNMSNAAAATATGAITMGIGFWCAN